VVAHTSSIFARHGIPEVVVSDNGPQFASESYNKFAEEYGFQHITSSPYHPEGNGEAERGVQIVKNLLKKAQDPYLALLAYRSTPLEVGYSPSQLLMSRCLRTTVPIIERQRKPHIPDFSAVAARDGRAKKRQKDNFDARRGARNLPTLDPGDSVWVTDRQIHGEVVEETSPRSYVVQTPDGTFRRNRRAIISSPENETLESGVSQSEEIPTSVETEDNTPSQPKEYATRSRGNRPPRPPDRFDPSWN